MRWRRCYALEALHRGQGGAGATPDTSVATSGPLNPGAKYSLLNLLAVTYMHQFANLYITLEYYY